MKKAILDLGFDSATPIQAETIPLLLKQSTDFLGLAATGTGKTAAYSIPLLENMKASIKGVQALVLCPTRELAKQVAEQMNLLARYKKTKAIAIYGGSDYGGQLRALRDGASIVVGTPGRIIDHLERGTLVLDNLQVVVLDEADEMISMGFKEEIETILEKVNQEEKHQTWLFSATMSREVRKIADHFLDQPKQIQIQKSETVAPLVKQYYYSVREDDKPDVIEKLIDQAPEFYGLIFCQTKLLVTSLTDTLRSHGYAVDCLHGDMEQNARERTLKSFKAKTVTVLVCTDVASRGIDVKELTHVINYSLPREMDLYVHRIGRTARGGKEGIAMSLVTPSHMGILYRIEKTISVKIERAQLPSEDDLLQIRLTKAQVDFEVTANQDPKMLSKITEGLNKSTWKNLIKDLSKEEIVARFLSKTLKIGKKVEQADAGKDRGFRDEQRPGNYQKRAFGDRGRFDRKGGGGGYKKDFGAKKEGGYQKPTGAFNPSSSSFKPSTPRPERSEAKAGGGRVFGRKN